MLSKLILLLTAGLFCFVNANAQAKWQMVRSVDGKFSVSMPCKPEIEIEPADPAKNVPKGVLYGCTVGAVNYLVTYSDFEIVLDSKSMLDAYIEGAVDGSTVISQQPLAGRIPGRELVFTKCEEGGESLIIYKWRILHLGKRMYAISAASPEPVPNAADISKFITSFTILR